MALRWILLLLAVPIVAADCEYLAQGGSADAAGDAPVGSDIVSLAWGDTGMYHGLAMRFREAIHTEHRVDAYVWRAAPDAPDIHLQCYTLGGAEAMAAHRAPALRDEPTQDDCAAFQDLSPPSVIQGTDWTVPWGRQPPGSADAPICSAVLVRIWHEGRVVEEAGALPQGLAADACPTGSLAQQGICYARPGTNTPWALLPGVVALFVLGRWRR